jgi:protein-L-isoaspartate(D-aspartate) O-methyltransferase
MRTESINRERWLRKRQTTDLPDARRRLAGRLSTLQVPERVAGAISEVPRHAFGPPTYWHLASLDTDLWTPTAFLPSPGVVARIVASLDLRDESSVLEYATGTGYLAVVLSLLASRVYTVEHNPWLLWFSSDAFRELEIVNIRQKASDGRLGWPEESPFDAIVIGAAVPWLLRDFVSQLKEGGVIVAPVGPYLGPHRLMKATKSEHGLTTTDLGRCHFPPLMGVWNVAAASYAGMPSLGG